MNRPPIHTAYCRHNGDLPTINGATAIEGFDTLGIKVIPFQGFGDIDDVVDCGPEALVYGYIGDVHLALKKMGLEIPLSLDYPEELKGFFGREIWQGVLLDVTSHPGQEVFVKPIEHKLFTGLLWKGSRDNRLALAPYHDHTPVWISEPVKFVSEYRCFILDGELMDVRRYKGDWSVAPARSPVEEAIQCLKGPRAYALDFGVTEDGRTLLVEFNDAYALGAYGLHAAVYARMIEARWEELTEPLLCN